MPALIRLFFKLYRYPSFAQIGGLNEYPSAAEIDKIYSAIQNDLRDEVLEEGVVLDDGLSLDEAVTQIQESIYTVQGSALKVIQHRRRNNEI